MADNSDQNIGNEGTENAGSNHNGRGGGSVSRIMVSASIVYYTICISSLF